MPEKAYFGSHFNESGKQEILRVKFDPLSVYGFKDESVIMVIDVMYDNYHYSHQLKQLEERQKELRLFSFLMAHEIQSPLRIIKSYSQQLVDDFNENLAPEIKQLLQAIHERAQSGSRLVNELMFLLQLENQQIPMEMLDMNALMKQLQASFPEIDLTVKGPLPEIKCCKVLTELVFTNLINNAVKFSNSDGRVPIALTYEAMPEFDSFTITDFGIGIAPEHVDKIFDPFFRLPDEHRAHGNGLGLTIVKQIIEHLGGVITVNAKPEAYTSFSITLPQRR